MKSIGEAMREIAEGFAPLGAIRRPLLDAAGCVLAENVLAGVDMPAFDNSAMDGYAARWAELQPGGCLPLHGESRAGGAASGALPPGHVMRIFTGAPLPEGADTVVIQENTRRTPDGVCIERVPERGANVRARASDLAAGSLALSSGQPIGPGEIALLAAQGRASALVHRPPRVAILSTGDELRDIGEPAAHGSVVNSNAYALAAQVRELGAEAWMLPSAGDDPVQIAERLSEGLRADAVLTSGGVSAGDYDLVQEAFARAGVALRFWKVAIKPGKPILFGSAGRVPVVGLPGNPVSAFVTFELFVKPALRRMAGQRAPYPVLIDVVLEHAHTHATGRTELARAALRSGPDRQLYARLHPRQGSGSLPSLLAVDALVVLPAQTEHFACGERVQAWPVRGFLFRDEPPAL